MIKILYMRVDFLTIIYILLIIKDKLVINDFKIKSSFLSTSHCCMQIVVTLNCLAQLFLRTLFIVLINWILQLLTYLICKLFCLFKLWIWLLWLQLFVGVSTALIMTLRWFVYGCFLVVRVFLLYESWITIEWLQDLSSFHSSRMLSCFRNFRT